MTMRAARLLALLPLGLAATASAEEGRILGLDGTAFELTAGDARTLLADPTAAAVPALALISTRSDGTRSIELLPGTDTSDLERNATLVIDDRTGTLVAVWERIHNTFYSELLLSQRTADAAAWSEPVELSGTAFAQRGPLAVSVSAQRAAVVEDAEEARSEQVVNLLWAEEAGPGVRVLLAPIALSDGVYPGANAVIPLSGFGEPLPPPFDELSRRPALASAREAGTVAVAFFDPLELRVKTLLARDLPADLSVFADKARAEIIEIGLHDTPPSNRPVFANKARAEIIEIGSHLHPSLKTWASGALEASLLEEPSNDLELLADKARAEIIEIGARALDEPGRIGTFVTLPLGPDLGGDIELMWLVDFDAPPVPQAAEDARLLVSRTGAEVVALWRVGDQYSYVEGRDGAWSPVLSLPTAAFGVSEALALLEKRLAIR